MSLLQISISASVFILAVVFLRSLLIHKLPKMTFMFLWGVANIAFCMGVVSRFYVMCFIFYHSAFQVSPNLQNGRANSKRFYKKMAAFEFAMARRSNQATRHSFNSAYIRYFSACCTLAEKFRL